MNSFVYERHGLVDVYHGKVIDQWELHVDGVATGWHVRRGPLDIARHCANPHWLYDMHETYLCEAGTEQSAKDELAWLYHHQESAKYQAMRQRETAVPLRDFVAALTRQRATNG